MGSIDEASREALLAELNALLDLGAQFDTWGDVPDDDEWEWKERFLAFARQVSGGRLAANLCKRSQRQAEADSAPLRHVGGGFGPKAGDEREVRHHQARALLLHLLLDLAVSSHKAKSDDLVPHNAVMLLMNDIRNMNLPKGTIRRLSCPVAVKLQSARPPPKRSSRCPLGP